MLQWALDVYGDERFVAVVLGSAGMALISFLLFAVPLTWLAAVDPRALRRYRVQERRPDLATMVPAALRLLAWNHLLALGAGILAWPLLRLSPWAPGWGDSILVLFASIACCLLLDDFLFYWLHRGLHSWRWIYLRVHSVHHRFATPAAIAGNHMHPLEFLAIAAISLFVPAALGLNLFALWIWIVVRQWEAAEQHCGYSFPWNPFRLLPMYDGPEYHDFHHSKFFGNYAGLFRWTDQAFATPAARYAEYRQSRRREAARVQRPAGLDETTRAS